MINNFKIISETTIIINGTLTSFLFCVIILINIFILFLKTSCPSRFLANVSVINVTDTKVISDKNDKLTTYVI